MQLGSTHPTAATESPVVWGQPGKQGRARAQACK